MDSAALAALFIGVAILAAKPGPGMLTVATKSVSEGLGAVGMFMVGTNLVKIGFFGLVVFGFSYIGEDLMFISILIKSLAALYLIWMGVRGLQKFEIDLPMKAGEQAKSPRLENFSAGFLLTLSNPFDILFFAGILPTIVDVQGLGFTDFGLGAVAIVLADITVAMSYALPLAASRHFFSEMLMRKVNIGASLAIIVVGLIIGYSALPARDLLAIF